MRALGYVRVSTDEQGERGLGSTAQREQLDQECQRRGWELVDVCRDVASGKSTNGRPGYNEALARMKAGEADVLLAAKLDRLSRSVVDFGALLETAKRQHWAVACLDLGLDMSTPTGELMANVLIAVAQFERRRISERTRDALAALPHEEHLNARGEVKQAPGRKRQISDDLEATIWWLRSKQGQSMRQIAATLTEQGRRPPGGGSWRVSTVQRVLNRKEAK